MSSTTYQNQDYFEKTKFILYLLLFTVFHIIIILCICNMCIHNLKKTHLVIVIYISDDLGLKIYIL